MSRPHRVHDKLIEQAEESYLVQMLGDPSTKTQWLTKSKLNQLFPENLEAIH